MLLWLWGSVGRERLLLLLLLLLLPSALAPLAPLASGATNKKWPRRNKQASNSVRRRARLRMTGSSAPRAAMAGSTAPGLAAGEERLRMLAVKRAKRWVSGCGAVELVMPAVLLKLLL